MEEKVIKRPKGLEIACCSINFNLSRFRVLEIDLQHINKLGRSRWSPAQVVELVDFFINGKRLQCLDRRAFGTEECSYYVVRKRFQGKRFKLVFCICSDRPQTIGIITLHRE